MPEKSDSFYTLPLFLELHQIVGLEDILLHYRSSLFYILYASGHCRLVASPARTSVDNCFSLFCSYNWFWLNFNNQSFHIPPNFLISFLVAQGVKITYSYFIWGQISFQLATAVFACWRLKERLFWSWWSHSYQFLVALFLSQEKEFGHNWT